MTRKRSGHDPLQLEEWMVAGVLFSAFIGYVYAAVTSWALFGPATFAVALLWAAAYYVFA